MTRIKTKRPTVYYGWYIVLACIFIAFVTNGARNSFGIFVIPLSDEFNWSRGTISFAAALAFLVSGVTQPILGSLFDRWGGRRVILTSLLIFGIATAALSLTFHFIFLLFLFGIVSAIALGGMSLTNTGSLLSKWFMRKRATVVGFNATGLAAGGLILVPFGMYLLQTTGWRITWAVFGFMVLLLALPLAWVILKDNPEDIDLSPDGDQYNQPGKPNPNLKGQIIGPLDTNRWIVSFRSLPMWQMTGSYVVCGATTGVLSVHFVPYALGQGISPDLAALIFGFMMFLNILGSLGAGWISDKYNRKTILGLVYLIRGLAYMLLLTVPGPLGLWIFAGVAGVSWIATAPLTTALTADVYGLRALGTISGISFLFHAIGSFSSVLFAGLMFDLAGSYTIPFLIAGLLLFPAAISAFTIKEHKYSSRYQPIMVPLPANN